MSGATDAYPFPTLIAPLRFAFALAAVLIVFLADRLAGPMMDEGSRFLLLGTAVMASAWFGGSGPALAATVLGAVLGAFEVSADPGAGAAIPTHLALFVVQGLLLTAVVAELRAARRASEAQAKVAQEARRQGEAASRMKDEFLATVSHELRTPLNAVLGWVHLLRTGKLDQETSARGLESIGRNVRLQAQLTGDLLDVSKALTGELQLESQPMSLGDAVQQALAAVESIARAKGVAIRSSMPDTPAVVLGDERRLRQIAWHLLANAIKFTSSGGTVELVVASASGEAVLRVSDSGQGIDPKFLPRIFDRFTQADSSTTRAAGGLGVGLALVRELVELHGGEIEARNREGGAGAVFTARFPLQPAELVAQSPQKPAAVSTIASAPLDGVRVLVVDEDSEGRELVRTVLQLRGAMVRAVGSVADALESLEAWSPDVLVSDSSSPEHASYTLVGKIRSLDAERGGRIPALALTTFARTDQRLGQMLAGVQRDLPKPVEPAILESEIARLVGRERRRVHR
jgi:signal transduction histidine kinase/ActR/RegA family two-component response regulator